MSKILPQNGGDGNPDAAGRPGRRQSKGFHQFSCRVSPFSAFFPNRGFPIDDRNDTGRRSHSETLTKALVIVWAARRPSPPKSRARSAPAVIAVGAGHAREDSPGMD